MPDNDETTPEEPQAEQGSSPPDTDEATAARRRGFELEKVLRLEVPVSPDLEELLQRFDQNAKDSHSRETRDGSDQ
ncbi:hypothetical protein ACWGB8_31325 [Kitasatospora sp. NPDC054939]